MFRVFFISSAHTSILYFDLSLRVKFIERNTINIIVSKKIL